MFLQMTTSIAEDTFGESQERVSGYVVAETADAAAAAYATHVRALYTDRLIRNESKDSRQEKVQLGTAWYPGTDVATMWHRLDFSLGCYKAKATGTYATKYGVRVASDYLQLTQNTTVEGVFYGGAEYYDTIDTDPLNPLALMLKSFIATYGKLTNKEHSWDKEKIGTGDAQSLGVRFSATYQRPLTVTAMVLRCSLREEITYSGTRHVFQQTPSGPDIEQSCGTTPGSRTVSGSVTAVNETACLAWVQRQHGATGLLHTWRGTKPADATVYEEPITISTNLEFAPLTDGTGRATGMNVQLATMDFTFKQTIPNLPAPF
jgi:hypothetical protein